MGSSRRAPASTQPARAEDISEPLQVLARSVVSLLPDQQKRLELTLTRYTGRPVALRFELDPELIGGLWLRFGDTVIDGSLRGRLEELRHHLKTQAHTADAQWASAGAPVSAEPGDAQPDRTTEATC